MRIGGWTVSDFKNGLTNILGLPCMLADSLISPTSESRDYSSLGVGDY